MKRTGACLMALWAMTAVASAEDVREGAALYRTHCAMCHGPKAYGDGPMAPAMMIAPADLTQLTALNGGVFPVARIVTRIDGRDPLVSHGSAMPVYGPFFDVDEVLMKAETGQLIMASTPLVDLVAYLRTLQE